MYACRMCDGMCLSYANQFHYMGVLHFIWWLNKQTRRVKVVFLKLHLHVKFADLVVAHICE